MITLQTNINDTSKIISQKVFLASKMMPIAIQKDQENQGCYKILFRIDENITGKYIFIENRIKAEDKVDESYIESKSIYIDNIINNPSKNEAFKNIMKEFDANLFYIGNFSIDRTNNNYTISCIKSLLDSNTNNYYYEIMNVYIPRYLFIAFKLYTEELLDIHCDVEKEFLFISNDMLNLKFEKVDNTKLVASTKKVREDGLISYPTMYEFNCGPTSWKFVYEVITIEDLKLKEPLFSSTFDAEYSQYYDRFIGYVADAGFVYIILKDDNGKIVAIKVSNELIQKTNIVDPYFIFDEE